MDFTVVSKAGLTQREFATLCGVSRVTVNLWVKGKMRPCRFIAPFVQDTLDAINHAMSKGRLPLPGKSDRKERVDLLLKALTK